MDCKGERGGSTSLLNELIRAGEEMLGKKLPVITEELYGLYERTGDRLRFEEVYFGRRRFLTVYGILAEYALMGYPVGDGAALVKKLIEAIEETLSEECWALPPHVDRRQPDWQVTVDLFAAETGQTLAALCRRLGDCLPAALVERIVTEVRRRVLLPYMSREPYAGWEQSGMNWNAVCNGCIGCIAIDLPQAVGDAAAAESLLARVERDLAFYLNGFAEDGTCREGLLYYRYGMTYYRAYAEALYRHTGGARDLLAGDRMARILSFPGKCIFPAGVSVSFSDTTEAEHLHFIHWDEDPCCRYEMVRQETEAAEKAVAAESAESVSELKKTQGNAEQNAVSELNMTHYLQDAMWLVRHLPHGGGLAVKGGHNGEPHNHNDVGSFLYVLGDEMLLCDLGAGEYTADYFGERQYELWCKRSGGHNVVLVDGKEQSAGTEHGCSSFTVCGTGPEDDGRAKPASDAGDSALRVCLEYASAYEIPALRRLERTMMIGEGGFSVRDVAFWADGDRHSLTQNLVTRNRPVITKNGIWIEGRNGGILIRPVGEKTGHTEDKESRLVPEVMEKCHRNHRGREEKIYLIRWSVSGTGRIETEFAVSERQKFEDQNDATADGSDRK